MGKHRRYLLPVISCIIASTLFVLDKSLQKLGNSTDIHKITYSRSIGEGTILTVINTPKSGTGSIESSFIASNNCRKRNESLENVKRIAYTTECEQHTDVVRTHHMDSGAEAIATLRFNQSNRKCVIATAIRDPRTWIPSLFMQRYNTRLCDKDISFEEFYAIYRKFIMEDSALIRNTIVQVRPQLLKEFGTTLTEEMKKVEENGGYSFHGNSSSNNGPFQNCELLFLRMEDHNNWADTFAMLYPGIVYEPNQKRVDMCPKIASHYLEIRKHRFSEEEKGAIIDGNSDVAEYFSLYGI